MRIQSSSKDYRIGRRLTASLTIFVLVAAISFSTQPRSVVMADQDTAEATHGVFSNPAPILCPDRVSNNAGTNPGVPPVYPSNINVLGLTGTITKITVTFAVTSTFPDDLDILLVGPTSARSMVLSDAGFTADLVNVTYTFDQLAVDAFPDQPAAAVPAGTYRPSNYLGFVTPEPGGVDNFPVPGPGLLNYATDFNIFNGTNPNGMWSLYVVDDQALDVNNSLPGGWSIDITTAGPPLVPNSRVCDFDGDNKTDLAVARPAGPTDLTWYLRNSLTMTPSTQRWGIPTTDFVVPHDYDGDGKTDIAIWRDGSPGIWYILRSSNSSLLAIPFGQTGDNPTVVDDYDGDGKADPAVIRAVAGKLVWYVLNSATIITEGAGGGSVTVKQWGIDTDFASPGDYDGDGKADYGVQRAEGVAQDKATFYFFYSGGGTFARPWGKNTDLIVPGDYDGDGRVDISVLHAEGGNLSWWIVLSNGGLVLGDPFGLSGDFPVHGDYDGDNKTDIAVWRPSTGTFHIKQSSGGVVNAQWGINIDFPVASYNTH